MSDTAFGRIYALVFLLEALCLAGAVVLEFTGTPLPGTLALLACLMMILTATVMSGTHIRRIEAQEEKGEP